MEKVVNRFYKTLADESLRENSFEKWRKSGVLSTFKCKWTETCNFIIRMCNITFKFVY